MLLAELSLFLLRWHDTMTSRSLLYSRQRPGLFCFEIFPSTLLGGRRLVLPRFPFLAGRPPRTRVFFFWSDISSFALVVSPSGRGLVCYPKRPQRPPPTWPPAFPSFCDAGKPVSLAYAPSRASIGSSCSLSRRRCGGGSTFLLISRLCHSATFPLQKRFQERAPVFSFAH